MLLITAVPVLTGTAAAQTETPADVTGAPIDTHAAARAEPVIAPLPMINPTLDNGLLLIGGALYHLDARDRTTPPSLTMGMAMATSNGSWGAGGAQQLHLHHDRYRVLAAAAYGNVNYDFYGIGQDAGSSGRSLPLIQAGSIGLLDGLVRIGGEWFAGARYQYMDMHVHVNQSAIPDDAPVLPERDVALRTAALGPRVLHDGRDNPFYATRGTLFNAMAAFADEALGGRRTYQAYQAWFSQYRAIGSDVLAWRVSACDTSGDVPFYDLCQLGKSQDLRGYVVGQYRDRAMAAAQVEYRATIWKRLGAVAFFGAGAVAPSFDRLSAGDVLPGGGAGLRFTIAPRNHVNIRADYAWGKDSHALYIAVAEAF